MLPLWHDFVKGSTCIFTCRLRRAGDRLFIEGPFTFIRALTVLGAVVLSCWQLSGRILAVITVVDPEEEFGLGELQARAGRQ